MPAPAWIPRLRDALVAADYRHEPVVAALGPSAQAALSRDETTPGLRATRAETPLETLTRLWLLQAPVSTAAAEVALPGLVDELCAERVLERSGDEVVARVEVRPYGVDDGGFWVASDRTPGLDGSSRRIDPHHVLGVSRAAMSLAWMTTRTPAARGLDLGTGCGVQSLHLATHVDHVVATDVNPRALWLARINAGLNAISTGAAPGRIDLRAGSFFEPVRGEGFDLIVTNPPFVISPGTDRRLVYRDSGLPGDAAVEHIVRTAPGHLTRGGICQVLANWTILRDQPWDERVAGWFEAGQHGCDAWVVQREVLDLPSYVELWLKDAGLHGAPDYHQRYDTWLAWFEEIGAEGVGFGWINLRRTDDEPVLRLEDWPWEVTQPLGQEVADHFDRVSLLRRTEDDSLLRSHLVVRPDVQQETFGAPGAPDPGRIVLRQQSGMRRARQVDTAEAALIGACDGELAVGKIVDAVAELLDLDRYSTREKTLTLLRELVAEGFLVEPA